MAEYLKLSVSIIKQGYINHIKEVAQNGKSKN